MFSCFSFQVFILSLKMPYSSVQKAFCVLEYAKTQSFNTVQRAFAQRFEKTRSEKVPDKKQIWTRHKKFKEEGCLCRVKESGRTPLSEGNVEQIRRKLVNSPRKSIRTSVETQIPKSSAWRIVRKRLQMRPYKLQFVQALKAEDKRKRIEFCIDMQQKLKEDQFDEKLVFSNDATFYTSGKVNKQNVRNWGLENPHESLEQVRDSPKVNVFCAISKKRVHDPYFFDENVSGDNYDYLHMLQAWLMDGLTANEAENFIFHQDGAPPHWKLSVRAFLNENLPGR